MSDAALARPGDVAAAATKPRNAAGVRLLPPALLILLPVAFVLVCYALPVLAMLARAVFTPHLSLAPAARMLNDAVFLQVFGYTLRLAVLVTACTLLLGYPVALLLARAPRAAAGIVLAFVLLPFWTSVLVRSYAWMVLLGRRGLVNGVLLGAHMTDAPLKLLNTPFAVQLAMVHILLPYMILPIANALRHIDPALGPAAAGLGASPIRVFAQVTWPLSLPGVAAGTLLVFVLSLGFYVTPVLVGGPRDVTLSMLIAQHVDLLDWSYAACLSAALLGTTLLILGAGARLRGVRAAVAASVR